MSLPQTYGLSSVTFGTGTYAITGYVVEGVTLSNKCGINAEIFNELGQRVVVRYDDLTVDLSFDAIIQGATLPVPGAEFTLNSIKYETMSVDVKSTNKEFTKVAIKGKTSTGITL